MRIKIPLYKFNQRDSEIASIHVDCYKNMEIDPVYITENINDYMRDVGIPLFIKNELGLLESSNELLYCISVNNCYMPDGCCKIIEGKQNKADFNLSKLWLYLLSHQSKYFVLTHNHPSGNTAPSKKDIELNDIIKHFEGGLGVALLEHYIVCKNRYGMCINKGGVDYEW